MPIRNAYGFKKLPKLTQLTFGAKLSDVLTEKKPLPESVDLVKSEWISPCYDQLQTSSCVLNMWAALVEYSQRRSGGPTWTPSRLFAYAMARIIEGDLGVDGGSFCHDAFHQMAYVGVIPESDYPFTDDESVVTAMPSQKLIAEAAKNQNKIFAPIDNSILYDLKHCMANGFPWGGGFDVPKNFEGDSPIVTLAEARWTREGHGVAFFGYDDNKITADGRGAFKLRNSWGPDWGEDGYTWMSYAFATSSHLSDVWMTRYPGQQTSLT